MRSTAQREPSKVNRNLLIVIKADIQQATIPNKKEKQNQNTSLLLVVLCKKLQQQHLYFQQTQLNTHTIILMTAQAQKIK